VSKTILDRIYEIKPKSIVYLLSGGKDSAAALILTRDIVKQYAVENKARVYILYVYVTGNTHPLNAYCAYSIGKWHEKHYGFKFVAKARNKLFQDYMSKYGLMIGPRRWCYLEFKEKVFREFHKTLPKPVLYIDGMKPSDSRHRREIITEELQYIKAYNREYWAWHPLFSISSNEEVLEIIRQHPEFKCILRLYEKFGDSLNCIVCPYKPRKKLLQYHFAEDLGIIHDYMKLVMRSKYYLSKYKPPDGNILMWNSEVLVNGCD